jgi:hypothetical protein
MKAGTRNKLFAAIGLALAACVVAAGNDHANGVLPTSPDNMPLARRQGVVPRRNLQTADLPSCPTRFRGANSRMEESLPIRSVSGASLAVYPNRPMGSWHRDSARPVKLSIGRVRQFSLR